MGHHSINIPNNTGRPLRLEFHPLFQEEAILRHNADVARQEQAQAWQQHFKDNAFFYQTQPLPQLSSPPPRSKKRSPTGHLRHEAAAERFVRAQVPEVSAADLQRLTATIVALAKRSFRIDGIAPAGTGGNMLVVLATRGPDDPPGSTRVRSTESLAGVDYGHWDS